MRKKEEGTTKVTIVLNPENLGKINLELINGKDGLIAKMTAENQQVKELLDKNLETLKSTLGSQGVSVNNLVVKVEETQSQPDLSFELKQDSQGQFEQNSSNSKESGNEEFKFEQDFVGFSEETEENSVKVSHLGQVDYKI